MRRSSPAKRAFMRPLPCTILAVDTAANSGWGIWSYAGGKSALRESGELRVGMPFTRPMSPEQEICDSALNHWAEAGFQDCVLVLERAWGGSNATVEGLGAAKQVWLSAWQSIGGKKSRVVRVYPQTWRAALGIPCGEMKAYAEAHAAFQHTDEWPTPDQAAAVCIGLWAIYAPEVAKVLPKKLLAAGGFV